MFLVSTIWMLFIINYCSRLDLSSKWVAFIDIIKHLESSYFNMNGIFGKIRHWLFYIKKPVFIWLQFISCSPFHFSSQGEKEISMLFCSSWKWLVFHPPFYLIDISRLFCVSKESSIVCNSCFCFCYANTQGYLNYVIYSE